MLNPEPQPARSDTPSDCRSRAQAVFDEAQARRAAAEDAKASAAFNEAQAWSAKVINAHLPENFSMPSPIPYQHPQLLNVDLDRSQMLARLFPASARRCHEIWQASAHDPGFTRRFPTARHFQQYVGDLHLQAGNYHE